MASDREETRAGYDAIAAPYAERFRDELARSPLDRAVLGAFAELVDGEVLEVGGGPGGVAAHPHTLGCGSRAPKLPHAAMPARRPR